ncbi:hypothetical protein [Segniliparus rotundus]|uniref:hypothetical protein n=1 Tax=Segniliparus rotundus TaxID=286802 RepID=UPI001FE09DDB|nr:hypothetical protein [Segniliparus rotundus]
MAVLGVSACTERGGRGPATVVQTVVPAGGGTSSAPASAPPSVSPINDRAKLCSRASGRAREIYNPSQTYWNLVLQSGFGDAQVNEAADKFREAAAKALPLLRALPGPEAPKDVVEAVKNFADTADKFSEAAGAHSTADEINPLANDFGHAVDDFTKVCPN